ncbi:unnamed protein product [Adineta steineri]|uniref:G-protein coupled receptors family 1 profile domain-containing protein n=1 Tax=Adineta steineri TaxID=433720 RepID=A0A814ZU16_9BILA|nr:unnamed protein product [Adineta steineri]CAF3952992.1 unnamed protein product [Adineta steineri]
MSTSNTHLIENLNNATFWINRISPMLSIIFGTFGNFFNLIIFTRRSLRNNPCSIYFLAGSIANFFVIYVALLTRYLATSWNWDPTATNMAWCKIRYFLIYPALSLVLWFIVLASIDRYFSSSHNIRRRQLSTVVIARKNIIYTTVFMFLINIHSLIFAGSIVINNVPSCTILPNDYLVFFNLFVPIISCILPLILMGIFGILTILNVRTVRNRIEPHQNNNRNERLRSNDRQLIIMLLSQITIIFIIVAPWSIINMYSAIGTVIFNVQFSTNGQAIYNFSFNLFRMLYYINPVVGFYIYTLSGHRFRVEIKHCLQHGLKFILTAFGLIQNQNQMNNNNTNNIITSFTLRTGRNTVHPDQHQRQINRTSIV